MICGPRQVGKTTLLRHIGGKNRRYATLDDPMALRLAKEDAALFLQRFPPPLLIDEIQYAPELLPVLKREVDRRKAKGLYWITGSQPFHLMKGVSESLAGRVAIVQLLGLSAAEASGRGKGARPFLPSPRANTASCTGTAALQTLYARIWRGSFPAIVADDAMDRDLFYGSYLQTYLQRDVRDLAQVGDLLAFTRFLRAVAARTGQLLNLADMARDIDIAPNTAKNWLSILQASGLIYLLEPYHTNLAKRLVKTPKLYFLDTGLAAYLTEWSNPATLEAGAMSGAILETWVVAELLKSYWHNGRRAPFYYYRDKDQKEIDLLIVQDGIIHPVEIKKSTAPGRDVVRHFAVLKRLGLPIGHGAVICLAEHPIPVTATVEAIPAASV